MNGDRSSRIVSRCINGCAKKRDKPVKDPFDNRAKGTLQLVVSLASQRVTLYSNGTAIARAPISTGTADHPTPFVYFMAPAGAPLQCKEGAPLTTGAIVVYRLGPGGRFDIANWRGAGGVAYELRVESGVLHSLRESNY